MNESDLDQLLREARVDVPDHLAATAQRLALAAAARAGKKRRERRWVIPVGVALGAFALTAAAPYAISGMERWPWATLGDDNRRTEALVPVDYRGVDGVQSDWCGAWMDVANASDADMARLNNAIEAYEWPTLAWGFARELSDPEDHSQMEAQSEAVGVAIEHFVKDEVEGLGWTWDDEVQHGPYVSSWGVGCGDDLLGAA